MSASNTRYRKCIIFMIIGLQFSVIGLLDDQFIFTLLLYLGPILTFSAAAYGLSDLSSTSESSQYQ